LLWLLNPQMLSPSFDLVKFDLHEYPYTSPWPTPGYDVPVKPGQVPLVLGQLAEK